MALNTAYDSTILSGYNLTELMHDLDMAKMANNTIAMSTDGNIHYVLETAAVAAFPAPIYNNGVVYVDARTFTTIDRDGSVKIKDIVENRIRLEQAQWEYVWATKPVSHENIAEQLPYHREIFAKWVSESVNFTYALNIYQSSQMLALASLYSAGQFYNNLDEVNALRLQDKLANQFYLQPALYETVTGNTDYLFPRDITEFVTMVKAAELSPRLNEFSRVALITMLSRSFWGVSNDTVLSSLAIDYPPALMVIIRTCIENTSFKRSKLGKLIDSNKAKNAHVNFVKAYDQILMRHAPELRKDAHGARIPRS